MIERSRPCSSRCALRALIASPLRFTVRASDAFSRTYPSRCTFCACLAVSGPYSASGGGVEDVRDNARVGEVWRGGSVDHVTGEGAAVMNVGSGGRVGLVTCGAMVVDVGFSDATEACVVELVDSRSKVSLLDCYADVTYECGEVDVSPARAREFIVKRLSDDATGIGGACLERANGDNPYSRSNVRLRVRDADGRVVDVPDVDGVLRTLTEVDDDEREMMWESMMGSPDGNR